MFSTSTSKNTNWPSVTMDPTSRFTKKMDKTRLEFHTEWICSRRHYHSLKWAWPAIVIYRKHSGWRVMRLSQVINDPLSRSEHTYTYVQARPQARLPAAVLENEPTLVLLGEERRPDSRERRKSSLARPQILCLNSVVLALTPTTLDDQERDHLS